MNIQRIEYVLAIVELKNIQKSARKCFVTQATLSTMIRKLLTEIGVINFKRKAKLEDELKVIVMPINIFESLKIMGKVGLAANTFFDKKKLRDELREVIKNLFTPLLPKEQPQHIVKPI